MQLTGAQALIRSLEQEGVDTIFGYPGGAALPLIKNFARDREVLLKDAPAGTA